MDYRHTSIRNEESKTNSTNVKHAVRQGEIISLKLFTLVLEDDLKNYRKSKRMFMLEH